MKTLTPDHIEQLYAFTQSNGVLYYDLQTELVDHLANDIENQWQYNQNPDFEIALSAAYNRFEKNGFTRLVVARTVVLLRSHVTFMWKCFTAFFTFPKLIITITLFFLLHSVFLVDAKLGFPVFKLSIMALQLVCAGIMKISSLNFDKRLKKNERVWLLEQLIYRGITMPLVLFLIIVSFSMTDSFNGSGVVAQWLLSGVSTMVLLHNYIMLFVIPAKAEYYLRETYPEYKLT